MAIEADIGKLFRLLQQWRDLPAYRLESRADPFFGLFMREVVAARVGQSLRESMIPEFPLRRGTLWGEDVPGANASTKVDYALFSLDGRAVYLVELKTDQRSRRDEQDEYLRESASGGFRRLVDGVLKIASVTDTTYVRKYLHLLRALETLGFLRVPPTVYDHAFPDIKVGLSDALRSIENLVVDATVQVQVLYVQPVASAPNEIGFDEFASVAERHGQLGQLFANFLIALLSSPGEGDPRKA